MPSQRFDDLTRLTTVGQHSLSGACVHLTNILTLQDWMIRDPGLSAAVTTHLITCALARGSTRFLDSHVTAITWRTSTL